MTKAGPAFQECTGSCNENVLPQGSIIQSTIYGLTVLARIEIVAILVQRSTILQQFTHTMKSSDPLLLLDVTLRSRMYPAGKVDIS